MFEKPSSAKRNLLDFSLKSLPKPQAKNYWSNGYNMNNNGYLANPTHSAQVAARNAGALTNAEASRMGLSNRR
jgi:hypothetical protein